jgi:DNA-binding IclR family transcriptional regulator
MERVRQSRAAGQEGRKRPVVQSAARGVRLLCLLARAREQKRLAEISAEMALPKVTVYRLLQTLVEEGLAVQGPEPGCYQISPYATVGMMSCCPDARVLQTGISQLLTALAQRTGATALLLIHSVGVPHLGIVDYALPERALVVRPHPGMRLPTHAVAAGKCYLAELAPERLEAWLGAGLAPITSATITDPEVLREQVTQVRTVGYAVNCEELAEGCWGMAVPVRDHAGKMVAALQLACPLTVMRMEEGVPRCLPLLQQGAEELQRLLSPVLR